MKNWYKNQKGSMAVYVTITILCFIFILTGLFLSSASIRKGQLRTIVEIVEAYQKDNDRVEEIYTNREILDTSKYVQNGLVLFYDGLNNTGSGHSNKATSWKDLTGSGYDLNLNNFAWSTTSGWTDNALHFDGVDDFGEIANLQDRLQGPITITVCFNSEEASNYRGLWGCHGGNNDNVDGMLAQYGNHLNESVLVLGYNSNLAKLDWSTTVNKNMSLTVQMDPSIGTKVYVNGELVQELENDTEPIRPLEDFWLGRAATASDRYFLGKMNNFMLYNRLLTDDEIRVNYKLDIQRYGIEDIPTTVQEAIERDYRFDETRTILDKSNNKITIPAGFKIVQNGVNNTEYANPLSPTVDDGIVVADTTGNEFVWVPVENPEEMYGIISEDADGTKHYAGKLYDFTNITNGKPSNLNWQEIDGKIAWTDENSYREPDTISNYDNIKEYQDILGVESITDFKLQLQEEFDYLVASINKYNGFYIGRYETGNLKQDKDNTPVVQKEKTDIVNVNWYYQYQTSKNIVSKNTDTRIQKSVTSSMIWGSQWDAVLNWFLKDANTKGYITNSDGMGWYDNNSDIILKATGTPIKGENEKVKNRVKNIYDMAGNVSEWTIEAYQTDFRVSRGGNFADSASSYPTYYRGTSEVEYSLFYTGFRSTLIVNL